MDNFLIQNIIIKIPIVFATYEFTKFAILLLKFHKLVFEIKSKIKDINENKLEKYKYIQDFKIIYCKLNKFFSKKIL
jgi:hypothetical protein